MMQHGRRGQPARLRCTHPLRARAIQPVDVRRLSPAGQPAAAPRCDRARHRARPCCADAPPCSADTRDWRPSARPRGRSPPRHGPAAIPRHTGGSRDWRCRLPPAPSPRPAHQAAAPAPRAGDRPPPPHPAVRDHPGSAAPRRRGCPARGMPRRGTPRLDRARAPGLAPPACHGSGATTGRSADGSRAATPRGCRHGRSPAARSGSHSRTPTCCHRARAADRSGWDAGARLGRDRL